MSPFWSRFQINPRLFPQTQPFSNKINRSARGVKFNFLATPEETAAKWIHLATNRQRRDTMKTAENEDIPLRSFYRLKIDSSWAAKPFAVKKAKDLTSNSIRPAITIVACTSRKCALVRSFLSTTISVRLRFCIILFFACWDKIDSIRRIQRYRFDTHGDCTRR